MYAQVHGLPYFFTNGSAVLTWDGREERYTFEALEGLDYPTGTLNTEELSFIDNLIAHNFLIVNAEIIPASEVGRRGALRLTLPNSFDLRGSQAALSTLPCWPPPDQPALSNPPAGALERARQKCRETFSDDFVLQNACIEQQEEAYRNRR